MPSLRLWIFSWRYAAIFLIWSWCCLETTLYLKNSFVFKYQVEDLDLLLEHVDSANYKRTCLYLTSSAKWVDTDGFYSFVFSLAFHLPSPKIGFLCIWGHGFLVIHWSSCAKTFCGWNNLYLFGFLMNEFCFYLLEQLGCLTWSTVLITFCLSWCREKFSLRWSTPCWFPWYTPASLKEGERGWKKTYILRLASVLLCQCHQAYRSFFLLVDYLMWKSRLIWLSRVDWASCKMEN